MTPQGPSARVDLHCHTARSDGLLEPRELFDEVARRNLSLVAITDHDSLAAYRELREDGFGTIGAPTLLAGVEINSVAGDIPGVPEDELHIIGLGVDPENRPLDVALARQREARASRIAMIIEQLRRAGAPIDDFLDGLPDDRASVGRPHLARALLRAGHVQSFNEAFDRYLSPSGTAYVPRLGLATREAIDLIVAAGGLPILAHFPGAPDQPELIWELRNWGLVGLEVYYSKFPPGVVHEMETAARRHDLLATPGTDYHGDHGSYAEILAKIDPPPDIEARVLDALDGLGAVA